MDPEDEYFNVFILANVPTCSSSDHLTFPESIKTKVDGSFPATRVQMPQKSLDNVCYFSVLHLPKNVTKKLIAISNAKEHKNLRLTC